MTSVLDLFGDELNASDSPESNQEYECQKYESLPHHDSSLDHNTIASSCLISSVDEHGFAEPVKVWGKLESIRKSDDHTQTLELADKERTVGRLLTRSGFGIKSTVFGPCISKSHFKIIRHSGHNFEIVNSSMNGTIVNGVKIDSHQLK